MTVAFSDGYTLPSDDYSLKNARLLHAGVTANWRTITPEQTDVADFPAISLTAGDTVDRWKPFTNELTSGTDLSDSAWIKTGVTVASDGKTLVEDTANSGHKVAQTFTMSSPPNVFAVKVRRVTGGRAIIRLKITDSASDIYTADFNLGTAVVTGSAGADATSIQEIEPGVYLCVLTYNPVAGSGTAELQIRNDAGNSTYTGNGASAITVEEITHHDSQAGIEFESWNSHTIDCMCIAAHNVGNSGGRIILAEDSNDDGTYTNVQSITVPDNSPIMLIFPPTTGTKWRLRVDRTAMPEIGVFMLGTALQMERPFYAGFTPSRMNRNTELQGNLSGSGELLGRSRKRTTLEAGYTWTNLTYAWVRANLDGPDGLIQSAELEPVFAAWRPGLTQDVDYLMEVAITAPQAAGGRDRQSFSLTGTAYSYE